MSAMVKYPSWENGVLGARWSKASASFFAAPMELSVDDVKGIVK